MLVLENEGNTGPAAAPTQHAPSLRWRLTLWASRIWWWHISPRIPRLVWPGDEVDVRVSFPGYGLDGKDADAIHRAQAALRDAGIGFDSGSGLEGRDWELDYSLRGPMRVTFRRRAKNPGKRIARPTPTLAVDNTSAA